MDYFQYEGSDEVFRVVTAPDGFFECKDAQKGAVQINRNIRAILLFNIKMFVYPKRVEIKGAIPPQVLKLSVSRGISTAQVISSPSLY